MALPLVDTNVFVRHLTQDHSAHSPAATRFFGRVERGEIRAQTTDTVVFETVFTLQKHYRASKQSIRDGLLPLIELPGLVLGGKHRMRRAFELYVDYNLSFADAYHVSFVEGQDPPEIVSFDRGLDRVSTVTRVELE